ncbi:MAG TPA: N-acetylmannosamine-6-phosphate 2-epimerase [Candidatus Wallbacteria bacterium]|nr:N-acetylmannosamine-6-phosphate 2-epimerase [Candidatus Wallbacteria bacterium]
MNKKKNILSKIKGGLIVSCQALEDEPLHGADIMAKMALAAKLGGAAGIRANGVEDIRAIKKIVDLPLIGIIKKVYKDSDIYITPTVEEVSLLVDAGADIIAADATDRIRPGGASLDEFYARVREKYPKIILMADISTFQEGIKAEKLGFDIAATTLSGYTQYTKGTILPNFNLLKELVSSLKIPVIAEGGIGEPAELKKAVIDLNAFAAVVGTAITRPREITRRFVDFIAACDEERAGGK